MIVTACVRSRSLLGLLLKPESAWRQLSVQAGLRGSFDLSRGPVMV